jgi:hypothetical protein
VPLAGGERQRGIGPDRRLPDGGPGRPGGRARQHVPLPGSRPRPGHARPPAPTQLVQHRPGARCSGVGAKPLRGPRPGRPGREAPPDGRRQWRGSSAGKTPAARPSPRRCSVPPSRRPVACRAAALFIASAGPAQRPSLNRIGGASLAGVTAPQPEKRRTVLAFASVQEKRPSGLVTRASRSRLRNGSR